MALQATHSNTMKEVKKMQGAARRPAMLVYELRNRRTGKFLDLVQVVSLEQLYRVVAAEYDPRRIEYRPAGYRGRFTKLTRPKTNSKGKR
jgi:hypothetical protein